MKTHPISVARSNSRGAEKRHRAEAADYNRDAALVESRANELFSNKKSESDPIFGWNWHV
jgi:hypothetical protein